MTRNNKLLMFSAISWSACFVPGRAMYRAVTIAVSLVRGRVVALLGSYHREVGGTLNIYLPTR